MTKLSWHSQQAKAQRASGKWEILVRQQLSASFSASLGTLWMLIGNLRLLLFIECLSPMLICRF